MTILLASWLPTGTDLRLFAPELVLIGTIVAILVVPLVIGRRPYVTALLAMCGGLAGLLATGLVSGPVSMSGQVAFTPPQSEGALLVADRFALFYKLFLLLLLVIIIWLWMIGTSARAAGASGSAGAAPGALPAATRVQTQGETEFLVLLLTSAVGMLLMASSLNLLVIIVAMETASLPSYAMVASDRRSRLGAEAALKYVTFGAASAALMVYGVSLLYGQFGTLDLGVMVEQLARGQAVASGPLLWLGLIGLGAGILFKIAAVPMHLWCPDVFEGAPIEVTTWLSVASKAAGLGVLLRIVTTFAAGFGTSGLAAGGLGALPVAIGVLAAITCTVGNLAALRQDSVKRTLAYSSIAHAGYMMMAAAILISPDQLAQAGVAPPDLNIGVAAVVAYLFVYVIMNVGAFGATALVAWQTGTDHISAFTGLGRRAPWVALPLAICLFSLVGLPPLGGFAAKWFLILALGKSAALVSWLWILIAVAVINTALSLYYYVRIVRQMYLVEDARPALRPAPAGLALINACALVLLLLGTIWFSPLGRHSEALASYLFGTAVTRSAAFDDRRAAPAAAAQRDTAASLSARPPGSRG